MYPAVLFMTAKLVLPTQVHEGQSDMEAYYFSQFPVHSYNFPISGIILLLQCLVIECDMVAAITYCSFYWLMFIHVV